MTRMLLEDRLPPQSPEFELAAIGAMLIDNDVIPDVLTIVADSDFWRDENAVMCRAIRELHADGKPVDALILMEHLKRRNQWARLTQDDTIDPIGDALSRAPHAANAKYHAQVVAQKAHKRRLIAVGREMIERGYSDDVASDDLQGFSERSVAGADARAGTKELRTMADAMAGEIARIRRRKEGEVIGVSTGFPALDELLDGFGPTQLIVLAARPGKGKSMLALNFAEHCALSASRGCLFVSQEMSEGEIAGRSLSSRSRIPHDRIRTGHLDAQQLLKLEAIERGVRERGRFWIDDIPGRTANDIASMARRKIADDDLGLVVVDYLQLLKTDGPGRESRQEQVARISRDLKRLAMDLRVPVIAVSQLNRQVEGREDHRPRLSDLRESGAIENDANVVILLHHSEERPSVVEAIVEKNRNGPTGFVELTFLPHLMRFESYAPIDYDNGGF